MSAIYNCVSEMTGIFTEEVSEAYTRVFSKITQIDLPRIAFLEQVATGSVMKDGSMISLDQALEQQRNNRAEQREYKAAALMRAWYENPQSVPLEKMSRYLRLAQLDPITNSLEKCLEVLRVHKTKKMKQALDNALKAPAEVRKSAIIMVAESMLQSGNESIEKYALQRLGELAIGTKNEDEVKYAGEIFEKLGVPELCDYVKRRIAAEHMKDVYNMHLRGNE